MTTLCATEFKPEVDPRNGARSGNWFFALPSGLEVLVRGNVSGPLQRDIDQAIAVLANLDQLQQRAVGLLEDFMKETGEWSLAIVDCGVKAEKLECNFVITLDFEGSEDSYKHGYTYFDVCFAVHERTHPNDRNGRPIKFVVGFH
ncbi:MAG TPA: hypothetical protein VIV60_27435 [Polyangiaceae bacterium]